MYVYKYIPTVVRHETKHILYDTHVYMCTIEILEINVHCMFTITWNLYYTIVIMQYIPLPYPSTNIPMLYMNTTFWATYEKSLTWMFRPCRGPDPLANFGSTPPPWSLPPSMARPNSTMMWLSAFNQDVILWLSSEAKA